MLNQKSAIFQFKDFCLNHSGRILLFIGFLEIWLVLLRPFINEVHFDRMGISWLYNGVFFREFHFAFRYFNLLLHKWIFLLFGFSEIAFGYSIFAIHLLNGFLIYILARKLKATQVSAAVASILFTANPLFLPVMQEIGLLLEFPLLTGFLGVSIGYINRSNSKTWKTRLVWFIVEILSVFIGMGSKESFIIYPAILISYEIVEALSHKGIFPLKIRIIDMLRRLAPHLPLYLFILFFANPFSSLPHYIQDKDYLMNFSPMHLIEMLDGFMLGKMLFTFFYYDIHIPFGLGLLIYIFLGVISIIKRRMQPLLLYGFLLTTILLVPVLPFKGRFFPPYIYNAWAGLALLAASFFINHSSKSHNRLIVIIIIIFYLSLFVFNGPFIKSRILNIKRSHEHIKILREELENNYNDICLKKPVKWYIPREIWEPLSLENPNFKFEENYYLNEKSPVLSGMDEFKILGIICNDPHWEIHLME